MTFILSTVIKLAGTLLFERYISFWYQSKHNQATLTPALAATINDTRSYLSQDMKDSQDEVFQPLESQCYLSNIHFYELQLKYLYYYVLPHRASLPIFRMKARDLCLLQYRCAQNTILKQTN